MAHDLTSRDGRDAADAEIAGLIRSGRLAEADAWLTDALRQHSGPIATACLAVPADGVELGGWDEVNADLTAITRRGQDVVTAVGLDLSGYGDSETDDWWDKEPAVEVAYYTDSSFSFSTASLDEMLAACETYAAPWTGRMLGDGTAYVTITGLREVYGALLRHQEERGQTVETVEDVAAHLGWWWQHLRFRQAVAAQVDARGLAVAIPVIAGEHSCGPWLVTVHPATRAADDEGTTEQILAERKRAGLERYEGVTREAVAELVTLRENCRGGWGWRNRDKRHTFVEYADARLALMCSIAELPPPRTSIAKMSDREFDSIMTGYVAYRRARLESF